MIGSVMTLERYIKYLKVLETFAKLFIDVSDGVSVNDL